MKSQTILSSFFLLLFVFSPFSALAQEENFEHFPFSEEEEIEIAGTVDCFDYYNFDSVKTDFQANVVTAVSGTTISFSGDIENENSYPLADGALYVKILKDNTDSGPDVLDYFQVKDDIAISANSKIPFDFTWDIPTYAVSGSYRAAAFFVAAGKFNFSGLTFTDDAAGGIANFEISGEQTGAVAFNKEAVNVKGEKYNFPTDPLRLNSDPFEVAADLVNELEGDAVVEINWKLYHWDSLTEDNFISSKQESLLLQAGETTTLRYMVVDNDYPVYYLVGTATYRDATSIISVRFIREDVQRTRLNFLGVTSFPLLAGQETTLFTCLHGMGTPDIAEDNELTVTLKNVRGKVMHTYSYRGDVSADIMGLKDTFVPDQNHDKFTLAAELKYNEEVVDAVEIFYDCEAIDEATCLEDSVQAGIIDLLDGAWIWVVVIALVMGAIGSAWLIKSKKN